MRVLLEKNWCTKLSELRVLFEGWFYERKYGNHFFIFFDPLPTLCQHFWLLLVSFFCSFFAPFLPLSGWWSHLWMTLRHGFKLHTVADLVNICQKNIKSFWDWILSQWPLIRWIFFFFRLHTALSIIIPLRWLKVAILKLPLPLPLLQTAIMQIHAILKAQTDAGAASSKTCRFL